MGEIALASRRGLLPSPLPVPVVPAPPAPHRFRVTPLGERRLGDSVRYLIRFLRRGTADESWTDEECSTGSSSSSNSDSDNKEGTSRNPGREVRKGGVLNGQARQGGGRLVFFPRHYFENDCLSRGTKYNE